MAGPKNGSKRTVLDRLRAESSRRILRAMTAASSEAKVKWLEAAASEEETACMFEAEKQDIDAAIHYVSAASCYAKAEQFAQSVPLLRAALSFSIRDSARREAEALLKEWLPKARNQLRRRVRKQPAAAS